MDASSLLTVGKQLLTKFNVVTTLIAVELDGHQSNDRCLVQVPGKKRDNCTI